MLRTAKILVTGPAGQIALPLAAHLAEHNEVWGVARFTDPAARARVEAAGVRTVACDLASGDFHELPDDFDHVLHLATFRNGGLDYDQAMRVNAEGTHLLLAHCRRAASVLVMSTAEVYRPDPDPLKVIPESAPLGDSNSLFDPTYSMSKIAQEAVARTMSRVLDLPLVIVRMNVAYGDNGGLPAFHLDNIVAGRPVTVRWDPAPYTPIHEDDIFEQTEALLDAASVPGTIVNWGGDEVVTAQDWCAHLAQLTGRAARLDVVPVPGTRRGTALDNTRRLAITGPATVGWRDGMARMLAHRYPNGIDAGPVDDRAAHAMRAASQSDDA